MNELERLLASLPRSEPSDQLDRRVHDVLSQPGPSRPQGSWRNVLLWCASVACIGLVGFYCGRWSVSAAPREMRLTTNPPSPAQLTKPDPNSETVLNFPLRQDQLAGLFVQSANPDGMLGNGPVKVEVSTSP